MSRIPFFGRFFRRKTATVSVEEIRVAVEQVVDDAKAKFGTSHILTPPVRVTPDWRSMTYQQKRSLAAEHSDEPVRNGADVERVLKAKFG